MENQTVKQQLLTLGMKEEELGNYCSDLYVKKNEISTAFVNAYEFKMSVKEFTARTDGLRWYEIAFAYPEYHIAKTKAVKPARVVKTYAAWDCDLSKYLKVGDLVDEEMYDHFLNVLPPATWTRTMLQVGEPHSHVGGRATYATFVSTSEGWEYRGNCHRSQEQEPVKDVE